MKNPIFAAILVFVFFSTSAHAADEGLYFSGNVGLSILSDADFVQGATLAETDYDPGFNVGGAIGYDFGFARAEAEVAYHNNHLEKATPVGAPTVLGADGTVSAISFLMNGYYDLHLDNSPLVPYLGVGIGFANVDFDISVPGFPNLDDSKVVFAYQVMAGTGYKINPTTTLAAGYRYFSTGDIEGVDVFGNAFKSDYEAHEFTFGVRVAF
jgi:OOP family OmpA-OmpF porin